MSKKSFLGIDVGSVTTKLAVINEQGEFIEGVMLRTAGKPVMAVQNGLNMLLEKLNDEHEILGVGTTGSGRQLAGILVGADVVKNEITAHAVAASIHVPGVQTILEIGGQDSKIIVLRDSIVTDFAMNTVCAAGTGSFLDQQASRLNVPIEEFGPSALKSKAPARIAGRCGVFAESDLIHKQQLGYPIEDLLYGLCQALVRNYLSNLALGKEILPKIVFQGGVASNSGMVKAFEEALKTEIIVPPNHQVMGAIGSALLAMENHRFTGEKTKFKGWQVRDFTFKSYTHECMDCANSCEVISIVQGEPECVDPRTPKDVKGNIIARWGGTCGKWDLAGNQQSELAHK
ncbi:MAG: 2-hydroxyglutaryl-CoA dehydratase [Candidatus Melainabacteria bacterium GWF2_37_15]|nr:MAG: 2-hydroxyglutaryl-CoA dehydratase [Candidatus Melainabacteria bacterium GWF2_37_15]